MGIDMTRESSVRVCTSCSRRCLRLVGQGDEGLPALASEVEMELRARLPERHWRAELAGCFRVCPDERVTLVVSVPDKGLDQYPTLAGAATPAAIAEAILVLLAD